MVIAATRMPRREAITVPPRKPERPAFNPDGTFDTVIDRFRYRVTLDDAGKTISVQQTETDPLYTPEAKEAYEKAELKKLDGGQ